MAGSQGLSQLNVLSKTVDRRCPRSDSPDDLNPFYYELQAMSYQLFFVSIPKQIASGGMALEEVLD
jgi:hypothetical protein